MTITRIPNPRQGARLPAPPARPDGQPYPFEMIYADGSWRAYADTPAELLALLIEGYTDLEDDEARLRERIRYAVDVSVPLQAGAAAEGDVGSCTEEQRDVLLGTRDVPPAVTEWSAPVPLVLVTSYYAPEGPQPRPVEAGGDITWLDPQTDESLLTSLHNATWISVAVDRALGAGR
jgi:hypothetical protein